MTIQEALNKATRLVSRLSQLQGLYEEISRLQGERAACQGKTDLGHQLEGQRIAYGDVANSLRAVLQDADTVWHLSREADYLVEDSDDPEMSEEAIRIGAQVRAGR